MLKSSIAKKVIAITATGALALSALGMVGCSSNNASSASSGAASNTSQSSQASSSASATVEPFAEAAYSGKHHVVMEVEGYEPITIELDADAAPITVTNFINLVNDSYYDGLAFYRIQDGFVIQGGTTGNTASGNDPSLTPVVGEFSSNGYDNELADHFDYGTIAMARTSIPDSATSTFFITLGDSAAVGTALDGAYAAFGTIDAAGMETIAKIVSDHLASVDPTSTMGIIEDEAGMPIIKTITLID